MSRKEGEKERGKSIRALCIPKNGNGDEDVMNFILRSGGEAEVLAPGFVKARFDSSIYAELKKMAEVDETRNGRPSRGGVD